MALPFVCEQLKEDEHTRTLINYNIGMGALYGMGMLINKNTFGHLFKSRRLLEGGPRTKLAALYSATKSLHSFKIAVHLNYSCLAAF